MSASEIVYGSLGLVGAICFVASIAAHVVLQFYIDHARIERELGEPGWKVFGSFMASAEFYKPQVEWLWKVRRSAFAGFFVVAVAAVIAGVVAAAIK